MGRLPVGAAFTPLPADAARFVRHAPGSGGSSTRPTRGSNGVWLQVYRAVDQHGQVIDVLVSTHRDAAAARRFFTRALQTLKIPPSEVVTAAAPSTRVCSTSCCRPRGTTLSSTPTIRSSPITASSNAGCDRCVGCRRIEQRRWSSSATPSCRTFATTTSDPAPRRPRAWPQRSPNLPAPSEQARARRFTAPAEQTTQQRPAKTVAINAPGCIPATACCSTPMASPKRRPGNQAMFGIDRLHQLLANTTVTNAEHPRRRGRDRRARLQRGLHQRRHRGPRPVRSGPAGLTCCVGPPVPRLTGARLALPAKKATIGI